MSFGIETCLKRHEGRAAFNLGQAAKNAWLTWDARKPEISLHRDCNNQS